MAAYVGQNYGKRDMARIDEGVREANKIGVIYSLVSGVLTVALLPYLLRMFFAADVDLDALLPYARTYIQISVVCFIPLAMIFIFRNTIQGCGYGMTAMMLGIMEFVARLAMAIGSMFVGSYAMAVASDAAAWVTTGFFGLFLFLRVRKRILKKWDEGTYLE
jgi:Na+-driven multidrug efflux pump